MIELADVPWEDDDVTPPPPNDDDKEVTIPWGGWVHEKPPPRRCSHARAVVEAGPSSASAAVAPLPPPPAPEPTYLLVQQLFRFVECSKRRIMRRLNRIDEVFISQGIELPPLPDSPASDEQDQEEEHIEERLSRRHPQRHRPPQRFSSLLRTHNQYHTTATVRCDC
ncbi:hypothetical protein Ahy_B09g097126 isoform D [Arachis hypogaea]|uniref:Uncharacterized protein n=1 Tax=Arachis hypogaea TaxID=3818 RepID=A0A444XNH6_ARAHY|nr:hypothetical protein Ahy_B09g097126 isoform D [Arachis hypogaea]